MCAKPRSPASPADLLAWLQNQANETMSAPPRPVEVPVAWLGRTSTDDVQDPTLSLPRQLDKVRQALPDGFVIVAKFFDVVSGRSQPANRQRRKAPQPADIPIMRDGGLDHLLDEARRPDRRFVAVVCESIDRVARVTYLSTKIEYELAQAGVALLAADEGIDPRPTLTPETGSTARRATPTLTRRIKQAVAEWYVLNMLELAWGGLTTHTQQGFNIGKPPYGYIASRTAHPVKARAREGKSKHRLIPDPVRGPVVSQIFLWRGVQNLGYGEIARRLNTDLSRYPPPDPILGEGRRRIGAWTVGNVREVLDNPKHTGYMVWNRRKRAHPERGVTGKVNPPSAWVWSPRPVHEPLVTRELFEAASTNSRFRASPTGGSRADRVYRLRSYVICDLCGRRMQGETVKGLVYYRCSSDPANHGHLPWFVEHPPAVTVRETALLEALDAFIRRYLPQPDRTPAVGVARLSRSLCDALHLQLRYHPLRHEVAVCAVLAPRTPDAHQVIDRTVIGDDASRSEAEE